MKKKTDEFRDKVLENVKKEFLTQYPQYNAPEYDIRVLESNRFDGNFEIYVKSKDNYSIYWCKFWNNEEETTYEFILEEPLNVMEIKYNLNIRSKYIYYDYDEKDYERKYGQILYTDYTSIEKNVLKQYFAEHEMEIRYQLARDILNGKIKIDCVCGNMDSYDGPRNKVEIYKV